MFQAQICTDEVFACAEAIVQSLQLQGTINKTFSITSKEGDGPGQDPKKWEALLSTIY